MRPKLKPETVAWWNGPNQEKELQSYMLFTFCTFFECMNITSLEINYSYCGD